MSASKLFEPITVGKAQLQNRVVLAPMTRLKNDAEFVPVTELVKEFYVQRSHSPGTLLITEGIIISPEAHGTPGLPGIWSEKQIESWKEIVKGVHDAGGVIFAQIWALGRAAYPAVLEQQGLPYISSSAIRLTDRDSAPRPLTKDEINKFVQQYAQAAVNAVEKAGFDGVQIHGANGYLVDQFLQDITNDRTDEYGGSVENRSRFGLEVLDAVVKAVGPERTSIRLSPWNVYQDMGMKDPVPQFSHFVTEVKNRHPDLALIDIVEPRAQGFDIIESPDKSNDFLRMIWSPRPYISTGGWTEENAFDAAENGDLVGFGRPFISNPDIVRRLKEKIPFAKGDRDTYYIPGNFAKGYTDYPVALSN